MRGFGYGPYWLVATVVLLIIYGLIAIWWTDRREARRRRPYDWKRDGDGS